MLEVVDGYYVYTRAFSGLTADQRFQREAQIDQLITRLDAQRR
jgi:hypothetical protein